MKHQMIDIKITTEFITLGQFLKIADIIETGGMAKLFLAENSLVVNGEEENRRGRKLYPDYEISFQGNIYKITK